MDYISMLNIMQNNIYKMFSICYIEQVKEFQETGERLWILQSLSIIHC